MGVVVTGLDELQGMFENLSDLPDSVIDEMLNAGADVVVEAQKGAARSMLSGPYATGQLAESIQKGTPKGYGDGRSIKVEFKGSRTRHNTTTRNAEIAFVNEFGTSRQPGRPFIETANEQGADEMVETQADVLDNYIGSC